ncbi:tetratricopeptide repeat protein [Cardiobacterium sp. Marseille-Q4385]|uniref:tetratricopeptide repeat protein n=1 Tax=Cardiobacterium sp. Marseille-Q4385 TaxID=2866573 RepID=UPI001CE3FC4B|nr:SEL1-like repeat protein [Cardiobacterium sp. Marseille-Q4385]
MTSRRANPFILFLLILLLLLTAGGSYYLRYLADNFDRSQPFIPRSQPPISTASADAAALMAQVDTTAAPPPTTARHLPEMLPPLTLSERETDALLRAGSAAYTRGDHAAAFSVFRQLAAASNALGQYNLGVYYRDGLGVAQDYDAARRWFEAAAAQGYDDALNNLGVLYDHGLGIAQDSNRARQYFEQAAAKGNPYAMYNLGVLYENGRGIVQDSGKAKYWFEEAATSKNGDISTALTARYGTAVQQFVIGHEALLRAGLAAHTRGDDATAFELFSRLAAANNPDGQYNLAIFYRDGLGTGASAAAAERWFERAAEYGHDGAMNNLAVLYLTVNAVTSGIRYETNELRQSKARSWLENAAGRGNAYAAYNLGILHHKQGDMDAATKWFDKAAEIARETRNISATREMPSRLHYMAGDSGCMPWQIEATETAVGLIQFGLLQTADCAPPRSDDKPAQITLNAWVQSGIMAEAQNHDVWAWYQYKKAAEAGHPVAQNNFADFYRAGRGLPQDGVLARQWLQRAAEQGYAKAQNNLAVLYQTGAGGEKDEKAAQGWYEKAARQGFTLAQGNLGTLYAQKADERMAQLQRDEDTLGHLFSRPDNQLKTALAQEIADINRNYALAHYWLEKAAAQQDGIAAYNLASLHARGRGNTRDLAQSRRYYEQAVAQGVKEARAALFVVDALASGKKPDKQIIENLLRILDDKERSDGRDYDNEKKAVAAYTIGWHYLSGAGVARDLVKARWWLERAADLGLAEAQYSVGNLDFYSEGFTARGGRERSAVDNARDKYNAARHWAAAAKQGHRNAAANLAIWCEQRRGRLDWYITEGWCGQAAAE